MVRRRGWILGLGYIDFGRQKVLKDARESERIELWSFVEGKSKSLVLWRDE